MIIYPGRKFHNRPSLTLAIAFTFLICISCNDNPSSMPSTSADSIAAKGSYAYDAAFLRKHTNNVIELQDENGQSKLLLSADYQGRVMTSTAMGDSGSSFGWINYDLISSLQKKKQFNPVGGEERFWLGPEGGQYALYFKKGDSFNIANWQVPPIIDTIGYDVTEKDHSHAIFSKHAIISNYKGTEFNIGIRRTVTLLNKESLAERIQGPLPSDIHFVAYETDNKVTNSGVADWKKENGLLSIWLLSMMTPTPQTTVIIPFHAQSDARSFITDNYFGSIPADRLQVRDSILYFTCDGKMRSKIGLSPVIAKPIAGSFDFGRNILTLVIFSIDKNGLYVNSKWEMQKEPYKGDVVNSYNDGPLQDGSQLGPFYEIESSSAAHELKKGEALEYRQTVCHFQGNYDSLRQLAKHTLGVELNDLKK